MNTSIWRETSTVKFCSPFLQPISSSKVTAQVNKLHESKSDVTVELAKLASLQFQ